MSRELGIPGILGTLKATEILSPGQEITLSCVEGDNGFVYNGVLEYDEKEIHLTNIPRTRMKIMMNAPSEAAALKWWAMPCEGIGHARMDVILQHMVQVHPLAVKSLDKLMEENVREDIERITQGYRDKAEYFIDRLAGCLSEIAATRYPEPVVVCMSDMETGEYAVLKGGRQFEPRKGHPSYGFRGITRYLSDYYKYGFELECQAVKCAREEKGLRNIGIMLRYCRSPQAADDILAVMEEHGLSRSADDLAIHLSLDLPANVKDARSLADKFDGFSVAARKLRLLIPDPDQKSSIGPEPHGEVDASVAGVLEHLLGTAHGAGHEGLTIRGRSFSRSQKLVRFLVKAGVEGISVNPEAIPRIKGWVADVESADSRG
jgi:pyruvate,water dikinase